MGGWIFPSSLCFSSIAYVSLISCLLIALDLPFMAYPSSFTLVIIVMGMLTSFFDLLSTPLVTFCVPVCLWWYLQPERRYTWCRLLLWNGVFFAAWAFGYGWLWASKWVIATLVLHRNVIAEAVSVMAHRTGETYDSNPNQLPIARWEIFGMLNEHYSLNPMGTVGLAVMYGVPGTALVLALVGHRRPSGLAQGACRFVPVALFALAWCLVVFNHTFIHQFMTFRLLGLAYMAGAFLVLYTARATWTAEKPVKADPVL